MLEIRERVVRFRPMSTMLAPLTGESGQPD